ncbi:heavy metal translocating P-type ATPase [Occallatibacter riparius]|uniref:P-type Zn(2+) transporter n=1 Tax=Occallatibacter riparius TaxID=1002689 RepID=A0A9J7BUB8_9BACT|nr:heavy metal translocating P-type ATPase [Occallatibacter riparius]UWZ84589.1 cadmium-translocating P-type ATPase [Occallatibacter riparius]
MPGSTQNTAWSSGASGHAVVALWILSGMAVSGTLHMLAYVKAAELVLLIATLVAFVPLLLDLARQLFRLNFSVDVLAALSIGSALLFRQYWVAGVVILMLSGGKTLEDYATGRASSMLTALAKRMPQIAHQIMPDGTQKDVALEEIAVGDLLAIHPHELCPVDGAVIGGNSQMDESYLTGEPFFVAKAPGATVLSGAINGSACLTIQATHIPADSRYARIVRILKESELNRPRMRRIADRLAGWYTPAAIGIASLSWFASGDSERFLAVLVIATPCPLILAIPVAIIGAISVAAKRGIIIKDPLVLEKIVACETLIADKTGTLTYGRPELQEIVSLGPYSTRGILWFSASLERYSKHPLSSAILTAARAEQMELSPTSDVFEIPGHGISAHIDGRMVIMTGRNQLPARLQRRLPEVMPGLESIILIDGELAGLLRFRDEPRPESRPFLGHVRSRHGITKVVLLSGDRPAAVEAFASTMGIPDTFGGKSPEEKLSIVRELTVAHPTLYIGDGINDAPAMMSATVGIAMGVNSDITSEAAGAVILQSSLASVDELIHISMKMRRIALTSAIGGMALSTIGIAFSALGYLKPIEGAILQEGIDLLSILYALRVVAPGEPVGDFRSSQAGRTQLPEERTAAA